MRTLEALISKLRSFIDWINQDGEKNAGLAQGSSAALLAQSQLILPSLETVRTDLAAFQVLWQQINNGNETNPSSDSGSRLLTSLRKTDQSVDCTIAPANTLQAQLVIFDTNVRRKKEHSDEELGKVTRWKNHINAKLATYKSQMDSVISSHDRNLANQAWMQWFESMHSADMAKISEARINKELLTCIDLLQALRQMEEVLTSFRNQISNMDGDLEQAVKRQQQALQTKSERLASYYKRQVGDEVESLLSFL